MKKVICRTQDLKDIAIIEVPHGVKPANYICDAPEDLQPGDESVVTISGKTPIIDYGLLKEKRDKQIKKGWFKK